MNRIRSDVEWAGLLLAGWLAILAGAPAQAESPSPPTRESVCSGDLGATTLKVRPGVNQFIPIALGHLNRLITPFDQPRVTTVDDKSTTQVNGRVVYFATSTETPVSLFISPEGSEEVALSLALAPCRIAPRELTLTLESNPFVWVKPVEKGGQAPSDYPYVDSLVDVFRELAQNRVPAGYNLRAERQNAAAHAAPRGERTETAAGGLVAGAGWAGKDPAGRPGAGSRHAAQRRQSAGCQRQPTGHPHHQSGSNHGGRNG
jgi:hypothetical protein